MKKVKKIHEPIIWTNTICPIEDFFQVAKGLNLTHIIYVQDSEGGNKSVWATHTQDLFECLYILSDAFFFGRIQSMEMACKYGFDDSPKDDKSV